MANLTGGTIIWNLDLNTGQFNTALAASSTKAKTIGDEFSTAGNKIAHGLKVAAVAATAFSVAAVAIGVKAVQAFNESETAVTQLNAVLKSTQGIAGVTAKDAIDLSKEIQRLTPVSDETALSAENMLLTFTKISRDQFPRATKATIDMATAMKGGLTPSAEEVRESAIRLGKALQDPILGITALRRVGVNFTDAQKDMVKQMVETGHQAEAQAFILKELETEFGGSAEAARTTFGGSLQALKNNINDLEESVGKLIIQSLTPFFVAINEFVDTHGAEIQAVIKTMVDVFTQLLKVLKEHGKVILELIVAYKALRIAIAITATVQALANAFGGLTKAMALNSAATATVSTSSKALATGVLPVVARLGVYGLAIAGVAAAGYGLYKMFQSIHKTYTQNLDDIKQSDFATGKYSGSVSVLKLWSDALADAQNRIKTNTANITLLQQQALPTSEAIRSATQKVADAQNGVNNALQTYGAGSPQYVNAVNMLRDAQNDLNNKTLTGIDNALQLVINKGNLARANADAAKATSQFAGWQEIINGKMDSGIKLAGTLSNNILGIAPAIGSLQGSIAQLQSNIGGVLQNARSLNAISFPNIQLQGTRATGGPVQSNKAYIIGETGPELFVPSMSGKVIPNNQLKASATTTNIGNINVSNALDGRYWLEKLTHDQEVTLSGLTPQRV